MKRNLILIALSLFISVVSLQAQEIRAGSLKIEYNGDNTVQVEIKGPMYFNESVNNSILFSGLLPGEYTIKVFSPLANKKGNVLVNKRISIVSEQRKIVEIERNGRISIQSFPDDNTVFLSFRHYAEDSRSPHRPPAIRIPEPLNEKEFGQLIETLKRSPFDKDKLEVLAVSTGYNSLYTDQIRIIMKLFSFDDGKLDAVKILAPRAFDPQSLYTLGNDFSFPGTKDKYFQFLKANSK